MRRESCSEPGFSWLVLLAGIVVGLGLVSPAKAQIETPPYGADPIDVYSHHFQDMYYIQPHNTYDYGSTLTGWLDAGFRSVELDVIDKGDWEYDANGPLVTHGMFGEQNNCSSGAADDRLGHCLQDIISWVDAHPTSEPLLVLVDMKSSWDPVGAWYGDEIAQLDEYIRGFMGSTMYSFNDLYLGYLIPRGGSGYPRALAAQYGWPLISDLRGKVIIGLTGGKIGSVNQGMESALSDLYYGYGRYPSTFMCPDVESDPGELNVGGTIDGISNANSQFFLCSNLKSRDHYQVTANRAAQNNQIIHLWGDHVYGNTSYTYSYIAVAHGIQAVGQDLTQPWYGTTWGGSIPYVGVRRSLPGYFKLRPTDSTGLCMDVEGSSYGNGSDLNQYYCHSGTNQRFVYTAEGQLRPQGNNRYCVDIDGGDARRGKKLHLWDCDGGNSEKWYISPEGRFSSYDGSSYCMDTTSSTAAGVQLQLYDCGGRTSMHFWLETVPDWSQTSF